MAFTLDFNDTNELIAEGVYEVVVKDAKEDVTKGGTQHISVELVVRNDIRQGFQNVHIWHKIWKRKEDGQYNMRNFNTIGKALNCQDGKQYSSLNDLLQDFVGKWCKVKVVHDDYNGQTYVKVGAWAQSGFSSCNHAWGKNNHNDLGVDVAYNPDDLPF